MTALNKNTLKMFLRYCQTMYDEDTIFPLHALLGVLYQSLALYCKIKHFNTYTIGMDQVHLIGPFMRIKATLTIVGLSWG